MTKHDHDDHDDRDAIARNIRRIRTEGVELATEAAFEILRNPNAPAQARSATINAIYRVAGLVAREEEEPRSPIESMTREEIAERIESLEKLKELSAEHASDDDVFG